jgi:hypothetical protein
MNLSKMTMGYCVPYSMVFKIQQMKRMVVKATSRQYQQPYTPYLRM